MYDCWSVRPSLFIPLSPGTWLNSHPLLLVWTQSFLLGHPQGQPLALGLAEPPVRGKAELLLSGIKLERCGLAWASPMGRDRLICELL